MDLGISLPTFGPFASPEAIIRIAQEAERLGYAAVWTYERLLYALGDVHHFRHSCARCRFVGCVLAPAGSSQDKRRRS
jgi:alkanesulfonate monooxygenase SsuD/methylene tetrahydromethanopterin reductase-like flavin-dependent oxidoreductase (luciferase family)